MPGGLVENERKGILGVARNHRRPIDDWVPPLEGVPVPSGGTKLVKGSPWVNLTTDGQAATALGVASSDDGQRVYVAYANNYAIRVVRSLDGGATWTNLGQVAELSAGLTVTYGIGGLVLPTGRVVFYCGSGSSAGGTAAVYSDNGGATWSVSYGLPDFGALTDIDAARDASGRIMLLVAYDWATEYTWTDDPGGITGFQPIVTLRATSGTGQGVGLVSPKGQGFVAITGDPTVVPSYPPLVHTTQHDPIAFTDVPLAEPTGVNQNYALIERGALYLLYNDGSDVRVHVADDYVTWWQQAEPVLVGAGTQSSSDNAGYKTAPINPDEFWLFARSGNNVRYSRVTITRGGGQQIKHSDLVGVLPDQHHPMKHSHRGGAGDADPIDISLATTGNLDIVTRTTGTLPESRIDAAIARDAEVVTATSGTINTAVRASAIIDEVVQARTGLVTNYSNLDQRLDSIESLGNAGGSVLDVRALVSILRTNFKVDAAHNFSKNALKGMVIDVFSDANGIDAGMSVGYIYNGTSKSVKAADGSLNLVGSKAYTETPVASTSFPDTGGVEMTDGVLGNPADYTAAAWAGWDSVSPTFVVDMGGNFWLGRMRLGSLSRAGSGTYIYFPDQIDFYGSQDGTNYTLLGSLDLRGEVESSTGERRWFELVLAQPFTARYVKCYVWAPAAGGWIFLDELEVYPPGAGINHGLLSSGGTASASSEAPEHLTSRGAPYTMTPAPDSRYPDTDGAEATDGLIGDDNVKNANYHGWQLGASQTITLVVDVGASQVLSRGRLGSLSHTAWGVYYPDQLAWEGSNDNVNWTPLATQSLLSEQETAGNSADGTGGTRKWFEVALAGTYRYVRCRVTTGGEWTFLDEIEIYGAAPATAAFDGSNSTAWQAAAVGSAWIKRDFGVIRSIGEVRALPLVAQTQSMTYTVEVSPDDVSYTQAVPTTTVTVSPGTEISATFSPTDARYVKVTASFETDATGFREVRLLGTGGASATVVSTANPADVTPNRGYLTADLALNGGSATFFMSRDNGSTWTEMPLDALVDISAQPMGAAVRVRAILVGGTELQAWGWGWAQ